MSDLHIATWGEATPVILVHGSIATVEEAWEAQRPLADQGFRLMVPDRRGYGRSPRAEAEDYRRDAEDLVALLDAGPAHLVGHSYGGLSAMLAAAQRPDQVLSLAVAEPPAFPICRNVPAVGSFVEEQAALWAQADLDDREFLKGFLQSVGAAPEDLPAEMLDHWTTMVGTMRRGRLAREAELPLEALASAPFPKLVVSGAHHAAFDAVGDELARRLNAERAIVSGARPRGPDGRRRLQRADGRVLARRLDVRAVKRRPRLPPPGCPSTAARLPSPAAARCREAPAGSAHRVKGRHRRGPPTPGDHDAEVPAAQALPRRPGAAPSRAPDGPVGA